MSAKTFKTIDEQISILREKGVVINNYEWTKDILLRENYFFITGYRHLFLNPNDNKTYLKGTTFEEIHELFTFDREIRNISLKYLLIVENNLKSVMSYNLSKKYGIKEKDYLRPEVFRTDEDSQKQVEDVLSKISRQIRINGSKHTATFHYINTYGYLPMWILIKVLSFGMVADLYDILKDKDQETVTSHYNGIDKNEFSNYLDIIANYRNLCAHEDILFENKTYKRIKPTSYHARLNIKAEDMEYVYGINDLFAFFIIMKQMLTKEEYEVMMNRTKTSIEYLSSKLHTISIDMVLDRMGFPLNYIEILNM